MRVKTAQVCNDENDEGGFDVGDDVAEYSDEKVTFVLGSPVSYTCHECQGRVVIRMHDRNE
jgi:hypothetical protein